VGVADAPLVWDVNNAIGAAADASCPQGRAFMICDQDGGDNQVDTIRIKNLGAAEVWGHVIVAGALE